MNTFTLKIVTPSRELFNGAVEHVRLPGVEGYFGVWAHHAPFLSILNIGAAEFHSPETRRTLSITGGYAEALGDRVTVIARSAEFIEDIDVARADASRKRAADRIAAHEGGTDMARAKSALQRALVRLNISRTSRRA